MHGWDKRGGAPQPAAPTHTHGAPSLQQPMHADGLCLCNRQPCRYVGLTCGCKNGDACAFCHAKHHLGYHFDYHWESMVSHGQSGAVATALASTQGAVSPALALTQSAVQQQTDAAGFCLCERPCLYVGKTSGCKHGDACHFCHAKHHPKRQSDRPSLHCRAKLKQIVGDFLEKGADPSILLALANHRPYVSRLLAQYLAAARPGDSERPTPDTGCHSDGQTPGAMDDADSDTDSDFGRMQEFLAMLEEAQESRS